jgi:hypothetical protein
MTFEPGQEPCIPVVTRDMNICSWSSNIGCERRKEEGRRRKGEERRKGRMKGRRGKGGGWGGREVTSIN